MADVDEHRNLLHKVTAAVTAKGWWQALGGDLFGGQVSPATFVVIVFLETKRRKLRPLLTVHFHWSIQ